MSRRTSILLLTALALVIGLTLYRRQSPTPPAQSKLTVQSESTPQTSPEPRDTETAALKSLPEKSHPAGQAVTATPAVPESPQQQAFKDFLEKMGRHSELLHSEFNLLEQLSAFQPSSDEKTNHLVFAKMRETFEELGRMAGTNDGALQLLVDASHSKYLQGVAVSGIGVAAENGNQRAIDLLLEPEKNGWLLSGSAGALSKIAQSGDEQAISFMFKLTQDDSNRALWGIATSALAGSAASGNEQAIAGLVNISGDAPVPIRNEVTKALQAAAANGSQPAASALKQMAGSNQDTRLQP